MTHTVAEKTGLRDLGVYGEEKEENVIRIHKPSQMFRYYKKIMP